MRVPNQDFAGSQEYIDHCVRNGQPRRMHLLYQAVYDDAREPAHAHIVARLQRYDRCLFFRFNRAIERWELWRWKSSEAPGLPAHLMRAQDILKRAAFLWVVTSASGAFAEPDFRQVLAVYRGDTWQGVENENEVLAREMDRRDIRATLAGRREMEQTVNDWRDDNKHQIRSLIGRGRLLSTPR